MKEYITYTRVKANDNLYLDPNTDNQFEKVTEKSKFYETPYELDGAFLAYVEYPDSTPDVAINKLLEMYKPFNFTFITEIKANKLLKQIGDISVKDFVFTDKRDILELKN